MARLHIMNLEGERRVEVILSRRNLLSLLQKLDMPGSMRQIENNDCYEDGVQTPFYPGEDQGSDLPRTTLVLRCEDDDEHYGMRPARPGPMHPDTERFVREEGGVASGPVGTEPAEPIEPADVPEHRLRPGGVMRCCIATLERRALKGPPNEGEHLHCEFCSFGLVYRDGAWEWDRG